MPYRYLPARSDKRQHALLPIYPSVIISKFDKSYTAENDWDKNFVKELNRRSKQFKKGNSKVYTWEETKKAAIEKVKAKRK